MDEVPIDQIHTSPYQPRLYFELETIKESITQDGMLVVPLVRRKPDGKTEYELIDGERRWRAAQELGWKTIQVQIVDVDDETAQRMVFTLNEERQPYTAEEYTKFFRRMYEQMGSAYAVAKAFRKSQHTVWNYINVSMLPEHLQKAVWAGKIPMGFIAEMEPIFAEARDEIGDISATLHYSESPSYQRIVAWCERIYTKQIQSREELRKEYVDSYLEMLDKKRVEKAKEEVQKDIPKHLIEPKVSLETPEEFEKAAEALRKEAERRKTPEQKAEEKRQKLIAEARKSRNSVTAKINSAEKILDVGAFRKRLVELEKSLEQNPAEVKKQLIVLGKEVTEAKKQRQKEIREEKRHKELVNKARKLLSSISFEECAKLGIDAEPYKNEVAEIKKYVDEKPTEAWNAANALKKKLEEEVKEAKIQKEAEKRAKKLEEAEKHRIAEEAKAKAKEDLLRDTEFVREFIEKEYPLMPETMKTEDLEKELMQRLIANIPEEKKERAKKIFREEWSSLEKRLKIFPEKSVMMEPKLDRLRQLEEEGVFLTTLWDIGERAGYAGKGDFHGNCPPQVVEQCVLRLTKKDELVVDPMAGSGTAIDVCNLLGRKCIAYDIKPPNWRDDIIQNDSQKIPLEDDSVDMIFLHPPYWDMVYYTSADEGLPDLSRAKTLDEHLDMLRQTLQECYRSLRTGKYLCILLGDRIKDGRFIPLCRKAANLAEEIGFTDCGYAVKVTQGSTSLIVKGKTIYAELAYTENLKIDHDLVMFFKKRVTD